VFDEPLAQAWAARYGRSPSPGTPNLGRFLTHRSVRRFTGEPVDEETVSGLVAAAQSASTSSNLQLWSVVTVQEPERREAMARLCADQRQVRDAAWFFAFLADHHRVRRAAATVGEEALGLDFNEFFTMAMIDAALAAERMVCAAESLGLGCCYIGALRNDVRGVQELLSLPQGTVGLFGLCIGWPDPAALGELKPRLWQEAVWFKERYGEADVSEYDRRMGEFYERQGMKGDATWSMRSGRRVDEHHLSGREALKPFLEEQGFDKR
jgi:nitroreductase